jgi:large subunit ribosomal protein L13e
MTSRPKVLKSDGKETDGKGFSRGELKKAGLSLTEAVKYHIPVDPRRKTAHEENVEALKPIIEGKKAAAKSKKPTGKSKS